MILVEIDAAHPTTGAIETIRLSSAPYCTRRTDTPADVSYLPLLAEAPQFTRNAFSDGQTGGAVRRADGRIAVSNADGRLDYLLDWGLDGRTVTVRTGEPGGAWPADYAVWMRGTLAGVEAPDNKTLHFVLRDGMAVFDAAVASNTYAGDNVAPNGVEGTADDLKGRRKPRAFGNVKNVSPPCVNASKLIYQVNDGAVHDVPAVYDRGAALTRGAPYADLAALLASGPSSGTYRVWAAGGLIRLGSSPELLTVDILEGTTAAARSTARVIERIAQAMGHTDIAAADLAALDVAAPGEVGVWIDDTTTGLSVIDRLAAGVGAFAAIDAVGALRSGRLEAPAGEPRATIAPWMVGGVKLLQSRDTGGGLPARRVTVRYGCNWTPQSGSNVAGSVTAERRAWLEHGDRVSTWDNDSILTRHPLAAEIERETLLVNEADAAAETARLGALYGVHRRLARVTISRPQAQQRLPALTLGDLLRLEWPRFGMSAGRLMRVIGIDVRAASDLLVLDLWG